MPSINKKMEYKYNCIKTLENCTDKIISLIQLESGDIVTGTNDAQIFIWNIEESKCIKKIRQNGKVFCLLEFEQNMLLSGTSENNICLWDLNSMSESFNFLGHELWITSLVKCNDRIFSSASNDYTIRIWDYYQRKLIKIIPAHEGCILAMIKLKNGNL